MLLLAFPVLIAGAPVFAAEGNAPSLDELLNLPSPATAPAPAPSQPPASDAESAQRVRIDPGVARRLQGNQPGDLFRQALAEMGEASERLGKDRDPGEETQRLQEAVLAKLDQVIAAAEQQQQQSSSSSKSSSGKQSKSQAGDKRDSGSKQNQGQNGDESQNPKPGDNKSSFGKGENKGQNQIAPGGTPAVTPAALSQTRSEWGNLPARVRDELIEGLNEPYSPLYRQMTERYYRAVAEQGR